MTDLTALQPLTTAIGEIRPTKSIEKACAMALEVRAMPHSRIGTVQGGPGTGKTSCGHYMTALFEDAYRICCADGINRAGLLRRVSMELGISPTGHYDNMLARIEAHLRENNARPLFIIDEADELNQRGLNCLRYLADETNAAVILLGSELLEQTFANPKSGAYLARMTSRIATKRVKMPKLTLEALAKHLLKPEFDKVSQVAASSFHKACHGNWRQADDLARACKSVMALTNTSELTPEIIASANASAAGKWE